MLYLIVQGDYHACKFFKWLDTNNCTHGTTTAPIVLAKFWQLEHEVELTNEELKQACAMGEAAKWKAERAKVARRIFEEKVEKFKITLVISWAMFGVLLILSTRFGDVRSRQMYLPGWVGYVHNKLDLYFENWRSFVL